MNERFLYSSHFVFRLTHDFFSMYSLRRELLYELIIFSSWLRVINKPENLVSEISLFHCNTLNNIFLLCTLISSRFQSKFNRKMWCPFFIVLKKIINRKKKSFAHFNTWRTGIYLLSDFFHCLQLPSPLSLRDVISSRNISEDFLRNYMSHLCSYFVYQTMVRWSGNHQLRIRTNHPRYSITLPYYQQLYQKCLQRLLSLILLSFST